MNASPATSPPVPLVDVSLHVNGTSHSMRVPTWTTLLDLLRETLHLTGTPS